MTTNKPEVKRYTPVYSIDSVGRGVLYMDPCEDGGWALLDDYKALQAECEKLRKAVAAVEDLIDHSSGVAGLHQNGEVAPWHDLRQGGAFESWLIDFDGAMQGGSE